MLMTADFPRAYSRFLITTQPLDDGRTLCEGIVFMRRSRTALMRALWQPLSLMVRRWLSYQFVADEARSLRGVRYNPRASAGKTRRCSGFSSGPRRCRKELRREIYSPREVTKAEGD